MLSLLHTGYPALRVISPTSNRGFMKTIVPRILIPFFLILIITSFAHAGIVTKEIAYESNGVPLKGFLAYDDSVQGKRPGVLVVHEWWGHNQHARNKAKQLAEMGYTALALDMYGDGKFADHPKKAGEFMGAAMKDWAGSQAKFRAARKVLESHTTVDASRIASIGFCFGGTVSIRMAGAGEDLKAVVAFHSGLPVDAPPTAKITASILVINGADDVWIPKEAVMKFKGQMASAGAYLTYISLPGVKHSFTNPEADENNKKFGIPNLQYDAAADKKSWQKLKKFFKRVLAE